MNPPSKKVDIADAYNARDKVIDLVTEAPRVSKGAWEAAPLADVPQRTGTPKQIAKESVKPLEFPSLPERALTIGGSVERVRTGFETLDNITRGGLRVGKRIIIGGAPGAGKTTFLSQVLWRRAEAGDLVLFVAFDEEAEDILIRVGQNNGIDRDELEKGDPAARRRLHEVVSAVPGFHIIDGDEGEVALEQASEELARRRTPGQHSILGVDSIQTARVIGDTLADNPRARVDLVMKALKVAGKRDGHLVIATCELARGAYRSNNPAERTDDLAAFKESGGVEYGASMAMVLRAVKDQDGLVDVRVPKNRMGTKTPFRLSLDFHSATFREVDVPDEEDEEGTDSPLQKAKEKIMAIVAKSVQPITSRNEIARRSKLGKGTALKAIRELIEDERLAQQSGVFVASVPGGSEPVPNQARFGTGSAVPPLKGNREPEPLTGTAKRRVGKKGTPEPIEGQS